MNNPFEKFMNLNDISKNLEKENMDPELDNTLKSNENPIKDLMIDIIVRAFFNAMPPSKEGTPHIREMVLYFMDKNVPTQVIFNGLQIFYEQNPIFDGDAK